MTIKQKVDEFIDLFEENILFREYICDYLFAGNGLQIDRIQQELDFYAEETG